MVSKNTSNQLENSLLRTSLPLFHSWIADSELSCVETTNHKECAGNTSRSLRGCDLPPIQTTWKSAGDRLSYCCHRCALESFEMCIREHLLLRDFQSHFQPKCRYGRVHHFSAAQIFVRSRILRKANWTFVVLVFLFSGQKVKRTIKFYYGEK